MIILFVSLQDHVTVHGILICQESDFSMVTWSALATQNQNYCFTLSYIVSFVIQLWKTYHFPSSVQFSTSKVARTCAQSYQTTVRDIYSATQLYLFRAKRVSTRVLLGFVRLLSEHRSVSESSPIASSRDVKATFTKNHSNYKSPVVLDLTGPSNPFFAATSKIVAFSHSQSSSIANSKDVKLHKK